MSYDEPYKGDLKDLFNVCQKKLERKKFWGETLIKWKDGKVIVVKKTESIKV